MPIGVALTQPESQAYPENSQATAALVLGILGVVGCVVTGPFAWYMANQEIEAIDEGRRDPANRGQAVAGKVLGIIATVFLVLAVLFLLLGLLFLMPVSVGISHAFIEIESALTSYWGELNVP